MENQPQPQPMQQPPAVPQLPPQPMTLPQPQFKPAQQPELPAEVIQQPVGPPPPQQPVHQPAADPAVQPVTQAPAYQPAQQPAQPSAQQPAQGQMPIQEYTPQGSLLPTGVGGHGEVTRSDIKFPELKLMHMTSKPVEEHRFQFLDVVVNGEVFVGNDELAATVVVLGWKKYYEQNVEFNSGVTAQIFQTEAEVHRAGFWTEWRGEEAPPVGPRMAAMVAVQYPAHARFAAGADQGALPDMAQEFPHQIGGAWWALCAYYAKGTAFTNFAKPVITATEKNPEIWRQTWLLKTKSHQTKFGKICQPRLDRGAILDDAAAEQMKGLA